MAGVLAEDSGAGDRLTGDQRCDSVDSLAEWRSLEQVENGTPSTSPSYWDTNDDDDGPSKLYGEFTWEIEKFSTITKRELRSNAFEVGGYKWYILIYPQGCDVCNHLSLFLCVANHDKLLPGWSHFAQFTIAVENKDPRKVKYSDTLHRFWKKEHDWGWKKFMELSKVFDGFIDSEDTLTIRAKVQVIREKADRPFRCLDCEYRRELLRVYLSNAEQICRRFVDERRGKLSNLIEDKVRWSSFRAFWMGIDQNVRRRMSRERADAILKVVVKHFFIEKEVTSTLVMDSLYSGLRVLECQSKNNSENSQHIEMDDFLSPMVLVEKDMFVLADDVLQLLERAAWEPLPHQPLPPKDEKASQCRSKDGGCGEDYNRDAVERDEKRLTELGRRTVEIFALTQIFSRIEVAYQEAVALKRQEELIREEEAAGRAENELKIKRCASQKEKRSKKKQAKKRKSKDKLKNEKCDTTLMNNNQQEGSLDGKIVEKFSSRDAELVDRSDVLEDVSNVSDIGNEVDDTVPPEIEDRDTEVVNWDTDASEVQPNMEASSTDMQKGQLERKNASCMDDSSSTCSTDSVPSVVMGAAYKGNPMPTNTSQISPKKGEHQRNEETSMQTGSTNGGGNLPSISAAGFGVLNDSIGNSRTNPAECDGASKDKKVRLYRVTEKEEAVQKKSNVKDLVDLERPSKLTTAELCSSSTTARKLPLNAQQQKQSSDISSVLPNTNTTKTEAVSSAEESSNGTMQMQRRISPASRSNQLSTSKSEAQKPVIPMRSTTVPQVAGVSRPLSAPLIPGPRPTGPATASIAQPMPQLSRSVSAAGRLGTEPSASTQSYIPQSYRNAILGKTFMEASTSSGFILPTPSCSVTSAPVLPPLSGRKEQSSSRSGLMYGPVSKGSALLRQRDDSSSNLRSSIDAVARLNLYDGLQSNNKSQEVPSITPSRPAYGAAQEEFPHLDIINELLDEEQSLGVAAYWQRQQLYTQQPSLSRQYTFPAHVSMVEAGSSLSSQRRLHYDDGYDNMYSNDSTKYWSYGRPDVAALNGGLSDSNGYPYQGVHYINSADAVNCFTMYPPANGP